MVAESVLIVITICSFLLSGYVGHKIIVRSKCSNFELEVNKTDEEGEKKEDN